MDINEFSELAEDILSRLDALTVKFDAMTCELAAMDLKLSLVELVLNNIKLAQAIAQTDAAIAKNRNRYFFSKKIDKRLTIQRDALVAHAEITNDLVEYKAKQLVAA